VRISSETELKELTAVVDDFSTTKTKAAKTGAGIGQEGPSTRPTVSEPVQGDLLMTVTKPASEAVPLWFRVAA